MSGPPSKTHAASYSPNSVSPGATARARRRVLIASAGGFLGFYLELSVVPYVAAREGGRFAAGLLTFALMAATVTMQSLIPLLLRRFSPRILFAAGLLLIGPPTVLYTVSQSVHNLVAVTLVRGAGFGLITVTGAALTSAYSAPGARGSSLGAYGVATSIWAAFAPALGVAVSHRSSAAIFVVGALPPVLGAIALIPSLPPSTVQAPRPGATFSARSDSSLVLPVIVFTVIAATIAAAFTFVPLLTVGPTPVFLVLFGTGFTAGRLLGGHLLDRGRSATLLVLQLLVGVVIGLTLLGTSSALVVAVGAAVSGLGIGCVGTTTLFMMFERAGRDGVARASVIWNMAYDIGQAVGAVVLGGVALLVRPSGAFLVAAGAVAFVAAPAAALDRRRARTKAQTTA